ncbi:MAG: hypothetical protein K2N89_06315 [Lachnospiraceae bacterium]|nr:hypothetical protein [Lachnospiraceae bacterium]
MKCYQRALLGILSVVIFLTGCTSESNISQKEWNYAFHYGSDYWKYYDFSDSFIPTQEDFEALVASYIPRRLKI